MKQLLSILLFTSTVLAQSSIESRVLDSVNEMLRQQGRIIFSELYNSPEFNPEEKAFLGRLYEVFFALPGFWKSELESTGKIPGIDATAASFGITTGSVRLLLGVMRSDPRVPPLFTWDDGSQQISSLNLENIEAFLADKGTRVRLTQWAGKPLPEFEVETFEGRILSRKDLEGKNALIYFWFTGCPPCNRLAPILAELEAKYGSADFQILGFNADQILEIGTTKEERLEYLKKRNLNFPNALLNRTVWESFGNVNVFPTLFFIQKGEIVFEHFVNFQPLEKLEEVIVRMRE